MYNYNIAFDISLVFGLVLTVSMMTVHTRYYVSNVIDT